MKVKILSGTFEKGYGVLIHHIQSDNFYHLVVLEDKKTRRPFIEIRNKQYFEEDIERMNNVDQDSHIIRELGKCRI